MSSVSINLFLHAIPRYHAPLRIRNQGHKEGGRFDENFVRRTLGNAAVLDTSQRVQHVIGLLRGLAPFVALGQVRPSVVLSQGTTPWLQQNAVADQLHVDPGFGQQPPPGDDVASVRDFMRFSEVGGPDQGGPEPDHIVLNLLDVVADSTPSWIVRTAEAINRGLRRPC